jgi:hypothetical protein
MDNSQQAILSEEALLLHTRDLFSETFDFNDPALAFLNSSHASPMPQDHESPLTNLLNSGNGANANLSALPAPASSHLPREQQHNQLQQGPRHQEQMHQDIEALTAPKRPRSPTILEAAAMAAEIFAAERNNSSSGPQKKPRPCDSCRRRKARCIMLPSDTGRCLHCEVKKQPCTFLEAPVRRNRTKKALMTHPPPPPSAAAAGGDHTDKVGSLIEAEIGQQPKHNQANVGLRLKYSDYASLGGHNLLKKALSLQYPRSSYYIGPTSVFDPVLLEATPLDNQGRSLLAGDIELRKVSNDVMFYLKNDYSESLYERSIQNVDAVEMLVAPHGRTLIDLYFRTVHPSFPILHKKVFLEKYERTHREFMAPLLAGVYILALNWWNYEPALSALQKPDVEALFRLGTQTFSDALDRPKLSSVQAGLLLLQCQPNHNRSWMLCSQVVAVTEELGIGLDSGKWRLPRWERGLRRRLAWAVWLQDKWLSVSEARPSHIDRLRTWHIKHANADDFPERHETDEEGAAEVEIGRLLFMEFIKLTEIVEDMTDNLFTVRSVRLLVQTEKILDQVKPLQLRLKNWYQNLPPQLNMAVSRPRKLCSNGYLHLAYFAAEITLHRRIVKSLTERSSPILIEVCRNAAKQRLIAAMEFVRNLRPEHLQAFWYSSSSANFALIGSFAALLHVTAVNAEEAAFYKAKLQDYRWVLRVSARGFEPMAAAMRLLDIALCRVPQLLNDGSSTSGQWDHLQQRDDKLWPMTGVATTPNGGLQTMAGVATAEALAVVDDDEEGDGQEDFSNETPRYMDILDHPPVHSHNGQDPGHSSCGSGTFGEISPVALAAATPMPGSVKSEMDAAASTSSVSPTNAVHLAAGTITTTTQSASSSAVILTPDTASAAHALAASAAAPAKRQAGDVFIKVEEQSEPDNKKQKQG